MSNPCRRPDRRDDANLETGVEDGRGVPRWVKLFGLAAVVLLALAIVVMLLSGGQHGPGRHLSTLELTGVSSASSAVDPAAHIGDAWRRR